MVGNSKAGFDYTYSSTETNWNNKQLNAFITQNFRCPILKNKENSDFPCPITFGFDFNIKGREKISTISLDKGMSKILPLFSINFDQKLGIALQWGIPEKLGELRDIPWEIYELSDNEKYIVIINPSENKKEIQVSSTTAYPQETSVITSKGYFKDTVIGKETKITNALPDFLKSDNYLSTSS